MYGFVHFVLLPGCPISVFEGSMGKSGVRRFILFSTGSPFQIEEEFKALFNLIGENLWRKKCPYHYSKTDVSKIVNLLKEEKEIEIRIRKMKWV
ncbi:MAG: hypothetical protein CL941_00675 [Desulfobacter sp.]|jgi:hypothetical protein|nr:hypothetical protein [Desulfobacter sp.]|tara:strand:+ start:10541 stop:10822 length:282 start_codon:yes stop_codon:yes gene_type:complete